MIETQIKIHDKFSFELKISFMPEHESKHHLVLEDDENEFAISSWLFVPNSLDINRSTYTKEAFYSDTKSNVRLITPIYKLAEIYEGENAPITHLQKTFVRIAANFDLKQNEENYTYQIKMFSAIVKSAIRDKVVDICHKDKSFLKQEIDQLLAELKAIKETYRKNGEIIKNIPEKQLVHFTFGDEYISNVFEQHLFKLLLFLKEQSDPDTEDIQARLIHFLLEEEAYKKQKGYLLLAKDNEVNNDAVIIHRSRLKKYIESDLYLHVKKEKDGLLAEQFFYGIAAATSMIFATVISFTAQRRYGNFTTPLFFVLVLSYAFKDRIKELLRIYFDSQLGKKYFDIKRKLAIRDQEIGWAKEAFDFVEESKLPPEVRNMRNKNPLVEAENEIYGESIILYRKLAQLSRKKIEEYKEYKLAGINDITRFNLSHFIQKMDNPRLPLYLPDATKGYICFEGDKLYPLNLIIRCQGKNTIYYKKYRLMFNRDGIKEIQEI